MPSTPPLLLDPELRKQYNQEWLLYDIEHPNAYWLRGGLYGLVCTRCGSKAAPEGTVDDFTRFCDVHLKCRYANGLTGGDSGPAFEDDPGEGDPLCAVLKQEGP